MRRIVSILISLGLTLALFLPLAGSSQVSILSDDVGPFIPLALDGRSICIDPGHGGGDFGAVGVDGTGTPDEKDLSLDIGLRVEGLLEAKGATVHMTRTDDTAPNLLDRVAVANTNGDEIYVSIHTASNDTYDRSRAAEYSDNWWDGRNPAYNDYSAVGGDCANFVSQCLMAGTRCLEAGRTSGTGDGVDDWGCMPFCDYLHENLVTFQSATWTFIEDGGGSAPADLKPGDVIIYGDNATGDPWRHAVFVVGGLGDTAIVNGHTTDRYHEPWDYAYGSFDRVNFYRLPDTTGLSPGEDDGVRTFYWGTAASYSVNGRRLAYAIQDECSGQLSLTNLTAKRDAVWFGYHRYVLQHTAMPAVLTELGFITNTTEFDRLCDSEFRQDAAQAIVDGIMRYFRVNHAPIRINSDVEFSAMALAEGWPGDGSVGTPYIIENYVINGSGQGCCIYIGNTTYHFTVRDCVLHGANGTASEYYWNTGLYLYNVINGKAENNTAHSNERYGFRLQSSDGNIIMNNRAYNNDYYGIYLRFSDLNDIVNNTGSQNIYSGIILYSSFDNTLGHNTIEDNGNYGIYLDISDLNTLIYNHAENNPFGIYLINSDNNTLSNNSIKKNTDTGILLSSSESNTVEYNNVSSSSDAGIQTTVNSHHNIVRFNTVYSISFYGIEIGDNFGASNDNFIYNNTVNDTGFFGIFILKSSYNEIYNNEVYDNGEFGIYVKLSSFNDVYWNHAHDNVYGICLRYSSYNNTVHNNTVNSNNKYMSMFRTAGIAAEYDTYLNVIRDNDIFDQDHVNGTGIIIENSENTTVYNNNISNNGYGLYINISNNIQILNNSISNSSEHGIYLNDSDLNTVKQNQVSNSNCSLYLNYTCIGNSIYHNNFQNHTYDAFDDGSNYWDAGYPSGGNYWDGYVGNDDFYGPDQDRQGSDGIGDTSYTNILGGSNVDNYPLMSPFEYTEFNIPLQLGWNLISLPARQLNWSIDSVLESIAGKYDYIQTYDANDPADPWKTYATFKPPVLNDLDEMNHLGAYWINITQSGVTLTVKGDIFGSALSIPLKAGWNLVGCPSFASKTVSDALAGTGYDRPVETFNATAPYRISQIADTDLMEPGEGYWVHVPADTTWTIEW